MARFATRVALLVTLALLVPRTSRAISFDAVWEMGLFGGVTPVELSGSGSASLFLPMECMEGDRCRVVDGLSATIWDFRLTFDLGSSLESIGLSGSLTLRHQGSEVQTVLTGHSLADAYLDIWISGTIDCAAGALCNLTGLPPSLVIDQFDRLSLTQMRVAYPDGWVGQIVIEPTAWSAETTLTPPFGCCPVGGALHIVPEATPAVLASSGLSMLAWMASTRARRRHAGR